VKYFGGEEDLTFKYMLLGAQVSHDLDVEALENIKRKFPGEATFIDNVVSLPHAFIFITSDFRNHFLPPAQPLSAPFTCLGATRRKILKPVVRPAQML
jgi:hypothetical protein